LIVGMGVDLVNVPQLASQLADKASAFKTATFTTAELAYAEGEALGPVAQHLAARFAAKEATLKALDAACAAVGVEPPRIDMREVEVVRDGRGRPDLALHGDAADLAARVGADRALVSLSHDGDSAVAFVVFERLPA
jgi:holo-[acyl-carrier protein] synthase